MFAEELNKHPTKLVSTKDYVSGKQPIVDNDPLIWAFFHPLHSNISWTVSFEQPEMVFYYTLQNLFQFLEKIFMIEIKR